MPTAVELRPATALALVLTAVGVLAFLQGSGPAAPPPPFAAVATITGLRYAGVVPWRSAVRAEQGSTTLTIQADGDLVHGAGRVCGGTAAQRVEVHETATRVSILVRGYADPALLGSVACVGAGHAATPQTVRLAHPLGDRALIDGSDGSEHDVLTDADVPRALDPPWGVTDGGVGWDDRVPGVRRSYVLDDGTSPPVEHVLLELGPADALDAIDRPYWTAGAGTAVHGAPAAVWQHADAYNVNTLVTWRLGADTYRVTSFGSPTRHLSEQQVVALAQSVQQAVHRPPAVRPTSG